MIDEIEITNIWIHVLEIDFLMRIMAQLSARKYFLKLSKKKRGKTDAVLQFHALYK